MIPTELLHMGLRQYGYLAGVSHRTPIEDKWAQRLYGLLLGLGLDVQSPVDVDTHGLILSSLQGSRDSELNVKLERYFLDVEIELENFRNQQVYT